MACTRSRIFTTLKCIPPGLHQTQVIILDYKPGRHQAHVARTRKVSGRLLTTHFNQLRLSLINNQYKMHVCFVKLAWTRDTVVPYTRHLTSVNSDSSESDVQELNAYSHVVSRVPLVTR